MTEKQQQLVTENMNLVYEITKKYRNRPNYEDIVSEGTLGLCMAASKFDIIRGNSFSTYAYMQILGRILMYINTDYAIKPSRKNGKYLQVNIISTDDSFNSYRVNNEQINAVGDINYYIDLIKKNVGEVCANVAYMLYCGYYKKEICEKLQLSHSRLNNEIQNMRKIFEELV